jgi:hypothetical protein
MQASFGSDEAAGELLQRVGLTRDGRSSPG